MQALCSCKCLKQQGAGFVPHRHVSVNQRCSNVLDKHGAQICTSMTANM